MFCFIDDPKIRPETFVIKLSSFQLTFRPGNEVQNEVAMSVEEVNEWCAKLFPNEAAELAKLELDGRGLLELKSDELVKIFPRIGNRMRFLAEMVKLEKEKGKGTKKEAPFPYARFGLKNGATSDLAFFSTLAKKGSLSRVTIAQFARRTRDANEDHERVERGTLLQTLEMGRVKVIDVSQSYGSQSVSISCDWIVWNLCSGEQFSSVVYGESIPVDVEREKMRALTFPGG